MTYTIIVDDCRAALAAMEPDSVDSIVTDPPYEYGFMGKAWDSTGVAFDAATWATCLRVLKPGGHLLSFGATRTSHRIACAIEDAGFEIRDTIAWMFGSGFPKSLDVSKAIDKMAGATRELTPTTAMITGTDLGGISRNRRCAVCMKPHASADPCRCPRNSGPATPDAQRWQGFGTALKPAMEPIIVARKPLGMTVAACVLRHGTGAINVDGCRVAHDGLVDLTTMQRSQVNGDQATVTLNVAGHTQAMYAPAGRWPANVILDAEAGAVLDEQSGERPSSGVYSPTDRGRLAGAFTFGGDGAPSSMFADSGGASRFFYSAKADGAERDAGLADLPVATRGDLVERIEGSAGIENPRAGAGRTSEGRRNTHATVKPIDLMRYLCRLVTPPGGTVLDPFAGSGTTLVAGLLEGLSVIGVEMGTDHACIAWHRCRHWSIRVLAPGVTARSGAETPTAQRDLF